MIVMKLVKVVSMGWNEEKGKKDEMGFMSEGVSPYVNRANSSLITFT